MKIKPRYDNVLLEIQKEEGDIGIILTEQYDDETSVIGKVIEMGPSGAGDLEIGSLVLFKKHLFDEVVIGKVKPEVFLLGKIENITAVVEK